MHDVQWAKSGEISSNQMADKGINFRILGDAAPEFSKILTNDALRFIAQLHLKFSGTRDRLLDRRKSIQLEIDRGFLPKYPESSLAIREQSWSVADIPKDLMDRRVEITGPVDRKMVINALNSGAQVYMADFEDSHSPTWKGTIEGQVNLYDAVRKNIQFSGVNGKEYSLNENVSVLFVRPRGWHLVEKHFYVEGAPVSASLFDFGLYFFHNASELIHQGKRPYFYLPKIESHLEARLWNDVFKFSQDYLGIPQGTIRATVLIETILAAFEMDEILYELKEHSAGLNCGRWDYIFSFIKKFRNHSEFVLPDRSLVTMNVHFLKSYCQRLIRTCHRRKIHAMGGMAAQIPIKDDPVKNSQAMERVMADKRREVSLGHDGTWVAHPGLVEIARSVFAEGMQGPNQIHVNRDSWDIQPSDLLKVPEGEISEVGLRTNVNIALLYLESWLRGNGCVPLYNLMEDAATAEISRAQIWQWIHHGRFKENEFRAVLSEELQKHQANLGSQEYKARKFELASELLSKISISQEFSEFLTLSAYSYL